jgi:hypothetical protein
MLGVAIGLVVPVRAEPAPVQAAPDPGLVWAMDDVAGRSDARSSRV